MAGAAGAVEVGAPAKGLIFSHEHLPANVYGGTPYLTRCSHASRVCLYPTSVSETEDNVRESNVETIFARRVRDLGGLSYKFAPVHAGNPDRIVLLPGGLVCLVELKATGERLNPAQVLWHRRAAALGTVVYVVTGAEEARSWMP